MIAGIYTRTCIMLVVAIGMLLAGCADKTIRLTYSPRHRANRSRRAWSSGRARQRGRPRRRAPRRRCLRWLRQPTGEVMLASPWPPAFVAALAAEFRAQGVDASAAESSAGLTDAYRLSGDVRNFSTESRWFAPAWPRRTSPRWRRARRRIPVSRPCERLPRPSGCRCGSCWSRPMTRRDAERWLLDHGFVEAPGGKTSHKHFHRGTVKVTLPGHGPQDLSKKHTGMIVRQLALAGFPREELRSEWGH
jgi:predicted RNA binding protein YcfA (HicA-like mRNA interferase family)